MIKAVLFDFGRVLYGPVLPRRKVRLLAKQLRQRGIKTGILSNIFFAGGWFFRLLGGYRGFDPIILSFKEKIAKPNEGIYEIAIKRLEVSPEEIIFVDNLADNVATAKKLGMKIVLAKNSDQIIADIKQILQRENKLRL